VATSNCVIFSSFFFLLPYFSGLLCPPIYWGFYEEKIWGTPPPQKKKADFVGTKGKRAVVGAQNIRYDFLMVGEDVLGKFQFKFFKAFPDTVTETINTLTEDRILGLSGENI